MNIQTVIAVTTVSLRDEGKAVDDTFLIALVLTIHVVAWWGC